jgi:PleD family two-component response regulator
MISLPWRQGAPLILVVDDERTIREMLRQEMEREGYRTLTATNGAEALELCQKNLPDMVLLDAVMPTLDGFRCCAEIRRWPGCEDLPVLMITSLDDEESVTEAFSVGQRITLSNPRSRFTGGFCANGCGVCSRPMRPCGSCISAVPRSGN